MGKRSYACSNKRDTTKLCFELRSPALTHTLTNTLTPTLTHTNYHGYLLCTYIRVVSPLIFSDFFSLIVYNHNIAKTAAYIPPATSTTTTATAPSSSSSLRAPLVKPFSQVQVPIASFSSMSISQPQVCYYLLFLLCVCQCLCARVCVRVNVLFACACVCLCACVLVCTCLCACECKNVSNLIAPFFYLISPTLLLHQLSFPRNGY